MRGEPRPDVEVPDWDWRDALRRSPPWAASLVGHLLVVAILGGTWRAWTVEPPAPTADAIRLELTTPAAAGAKGTATTTAATRAQSPKVEPSTAPEKPRTVGGGGQPDTVDDAVDPTAPSMADALDAVKLVQGQRAGEVSRRTPAGRAEGVARYGGSRGTESAVERGLQWLARHQDASGRWDSDEYTMRCRPGARCCDAGEPTGFAGYDVGQTALALLAFQGAGYTHRAGAHRETVSRGLTWLVKQQRADGAFCPEGRYPSKYAYHHALATFAIAEALALTRDRRLKTPLRRAVRFLERAQQSKGGWNYRPGTAERNDSSVTGWVVVALESARVAGAPVSREVLGGAIEHVQRLTMPTGELLYIDNPNKRETNDALTAVGLVCRLLLGDRADSPAVQAAARQLRMAPPDPARWGTRGGCLYYWYYGTLGAFLVGGETWTTWNAALKPALLKTQRTAGCERGSWPAESLWARQGGGRIYATATAVLCLEAYYRYVPELLRKRARPLEGLWKRR